MRRQHRTVLVRHKGMRGIGLAVSLLAVWLLSLLAPMQRASHGIDEIRLAGHHAVGAGAICGQTGQDDQDPDLPVCPAKAVCGGGLLPPTGASAADDRLFLSTILPARTGQLPPYRFPKGEARPRAPPVAALG